VRRGVWVPEAWLRSGNPVRGLRRRPPRGAWRPASSWTTPSSRPARRCGSRGPAAAPAAPATVALPGSSPATTTAGLTEPSRSVSVCPRLRAGGTRRGAVWATLSSFVDVQRSRSIRTAVLLASPQWWSSSPSRSSVAEAVEAFRAVGTKFFRTSGSPAFAKNATAKAAPSLPPPAPFPRVRSADLFLHHPPPPPVPLPNPPQLFRRPGTQYPEHTDHHEHQPTVWILKPACSR